MPGYICMTETFSTRSRIKNIEIITRPYLHYRKRKKVLVTHFTTHRNDVFFQINGTFG